MMEAPLRWEDRADGNGSVARTARDPYEVERITIAGNPWFRTRQNDREVGGNGTWKGPRSWRAPLPTLPHGEDKGQELYPSRARARV
jgi:hypothetical protein